MLETMRWFGHDAFCLTADKVVFIDPFEIKQGLAADLILITHEHFDHFSPNDLQKLCTPDTVVVTTPMVAKKLTCSAKSVKPGDNLTVQGIPIEVVPAYNTDKRFHPKQDQKLGFVISIGGERIYHAGDTDLIPEMSDIRCDTALLPVSGTYVMTADEAAEAALRIRPKTAIPMHWGSIIGSESDAKRFRDLLKGKIEVRILPRTVG